MKKLIPPCLIQALSQKFHPDKNSLKTHKKKPTKLSAKFDKRYFMKPCQTNTNLSFAIGYMNHLAPQRVTPALS